MCGRFVGFSNLDALQLYFPIDRVEAEVAPNYNVAPTQKVLAILRENHENVLRRLHWGLVPFWARDASIGSRIINARAETVSAKPAFRAAFRKRRSLIPADGFYEWKGEKSPKQPMLITLPDETPFAFAGLWEIWDAKGQADPLVSCTILTTDSSPAIREIHHRMPVILKSAAFMDWLDPERQDVDLEAMLAEMVHKEFRARPVSLAVNSTRNNSPDLIGRA
jgi:putative SOS response-associated peptidase YedK